MKTVRWAKFVNIVTLTEKRQWNKFIRFRKKFTEQSSQRKPFPSISEKEWIRIPFPTKPEKQPSKAILAGLAYFWQAVRSEQIKDLCHWCRAWVWTDLLFAIGAGITIMQIWHMLEVRIFPFCFPSLREFSLIFLLRNSNNQYLRGTKEGAHTWVSAPLLFAVLLQLLFVCLAMHIYIF